MGPTPAPARKKEGVCTDVAMRERTQNHCEISTSQLQGSFIKHTSCGMNVYNLIANLDSNHDQQ